LPDGQTVSAAIIDHPSNPLSDWHCSLGARVINPCISGEHEVPLKANVPLSLRYRVVALDGEFDAKTMADLVSSWQGK
jgi:hypothetical protein